MPKAEDDEDKEDQQQTDDENQDDEKTQDDTQTDDSQTDDSQTDQDQTDDSTNDQDKNKTTRTPIRPTTVTKTNLTITATTIATIRIRRMIIRTQIQMIHQVLIQIKTKQTLPTKHKRTHHQQPKKQIKQKPSPLGDGFFFQKTSLSREVFIDSSHDIYKNAFHFSKQLIKLNKAMVLSRLQENKLHPFSPIDRLCGK